MEFVSWDDDIPEYIYINIKFMETKPPTRFGVSSPHENSRNGQNSSFLPPPKKIWSKSLCRCISWSLLRPPRTEVFALGIPGRSPWNALGYHGCHGYGCHG